MPIVEIFYIKMKNVEKMDKFLPVYSRLICRCRSILPLLAVFLYFFRKGSWCLGGKKLLLGQRNKKRGSARLPESI